MNLEHNIAGFPILSVMVYLPVLTAIVLLFIRGNAGIRWVAAIGAFIDLVISVVALGLYASKYFNSGIPQKDSFDFQENVAWLTDLRIGYHLGADAIAVLLLVLTTLLTFISILVSWGPIQKRVREYYIMMLLLQAGMMGVFVSLDFFVFPSIVLLLRMLTAYLQAVAAPSVFGLRTSSPTARRACRTLGASA